MENLALYFILTTSNLDLPPDLLASICYIESRYKPGAVHHDDGNSDSLGTCQMKLGTARQFGFKGTAKDLQHNSQANIFYAGKYLKHQLDRYHENEVKAVAAYNSGTYRGNAKNAQYVNKVYKRWKKAPHDYH